MSSVRLFFKKIQLKECKQSTYNVNGIDISTVFDKVSDGLQMTIVGSPDQRALSHLHVKIIFNFT